MELTTHERIFLVTSLPKKGTIEDMVVLKDLDDKIRFTQDEVKALELRTEGGQIKWKPESAESVEVEFTDAEKELLNKHLSDISEKGEFPMELLGLHTKLK